MISNPPKTGHIAYNWIKSGKLPKPRKLGVRMVAWPVEVIREKVHSGELLA